MQIKQILNNNAVAAIDDAGQDVILMGKGIGWQSKKGEEADAAKIEKIFRMETDSQQENFKKLLLEASAEVVAVSMLIIDYAKDKLGCQLNKNVYLTLTDHISFAIERQGMGCNFTGPMAYDIKRFYPHEYRIGQKALNFILVRLHVKLPDEEAAAIALHIINAEYERDMSETMGIAEITSKALNLVRYTFMLKFDENDLNYQRFVTHLRFFAQRVMEGKLLDSGQEEIFQGLSIKYPKQVQTAEKICHIAAELYDVDITPEEIGFLTVHIVRLTNKLK